MTIEELKAAGIADEQIEAIMKMHESSIKELTKKTEGVEALTVKASDLEKQLSEANNQIEAFKGMDIDGIKKAADDWKIKYEDDMKTAKEQLEQVEYDSILRENLANIKFSSELAKKAAFNEFKAKGLKREKDKILGLEDAIKAMQETDKGAFITETQDTQQQSFMPTGTALWQPEGNKSAAAEQKFDFNFTPLRPKDQKAN